MIAIFKKDLSNYFKSPIAYVTIPFLLLICGFLFFVRVQYYSSVSIQAMMNPMSAKQLNVSEFIIIPHISSMMFLLLFFTPLFTMRLFSEEKKIGTLELLFTYPLTETQLIAGKLLSCAVVVLSGALLTLTYPILLFKFYPSLDWSNIITGYTGIILMSISFISLGMWISSLTDSQVISGFCTFGALLMFWIIGWAGNITQGVYAKIFSGISLLDHFDSFTKGIIDTNDVIFFLCFIFLFLYLTYNNLLSRKWRG